MNYYHCSFKNPGFGVRGVLLLDWLPTKTNELVCPPSYIARNSLVPTLSNTDVNGIGKGTLM